MSIIAICGFIGSGKNTAAEYLASDCKFTRVSFASSLKDAVSAVFGWDRQLLEGTTEESRLWREQTDLWWSNRLQIPNLTPRWVLQHWGTDLIRNNFHQDIWIASLEHKLNKLGDRIVISDCRFVNEIGTIKKLGGKVIWVRRGSLPSWYDCAMQTLSAEKEQSQLPDKNMYSKYPKVHISEWAWLATDFDLVIDNNDTIYDLYQQIENLVY
jgi:hypothetical protein